MPQPWKLVAPSKGSQGCRQASRPRFFACGSSLLPAAGVVVRQPRPHVCILLKPCPHFASASTAYHSFKKTLSVSSRLHESDQVSLMLLWLLPDAGVLVRQPCLHMPEPVLPLGTSQDSRSLLLEDRRRAITPSGIISLFPPPCHRCRCTAAWPSQAWAMQLTGL